MSSLNKIENAHILVAAIAKIKENIQPAESKEDATFFWTTLKFQDEIFEITAVKFSFPEIANVLRQDFFIDQYIQGVGIVWLVKEVVN